MMGAFAPDCWDICDLSSETAEQNAMKLDRKQDFNASTMFVLKPSQAFTHSQYYYTA